MHPVNQNKLLNYKEKMRQRNLLLTMSAAVCLCTQAQQQSSLTHEGNGLLKGDFVRHRIEYFDAGQGGENMLWEYPIVYQDNHETTVNVDADILGIYRITDGNHADFFIERPDSQKVTLFQCSEENPLSRTEYTDPLLRIQYPFEYGDSIFKPFRGNGVYSGDHHFLKRGATVVMGDATGSLIVNEEDTLHNVLRVYTLKSYSVCMDLKAEALDTAQLRQVIEGRYEWYARGYRYPILETVTSTSYHNMDALGTTRRAWCCLPSEQLALNDSVNREIQRNDSIARILAEQAEKDIIHYTTTVNNGVVTLNYDLDASAHIITLVADAFGMTYRRAEWIQSEGTDYIRQLDCNGLRRVTYILYINVNGRIYSEKVSL